MTDEPDPKAEPPFQPSTQPTLAEARRLFVGVRVSLATANALARATETLARRAREVGVEVKWVPPVNYHVTLRFLGWARVETVVAVRDVLEQAARGTSRLSFRTTRLGAFGSLDKATVVWAGVEDASGTLAALAGRIDTAMAGLGFAAESRPFRPHVTIGRLRETRAIKDIVLPLAEQMFGDTRIDTVSLFETETKSDGSVYREISRIEFKPAETVPERQTRPVELGASEDFSATDTDDGWPRGQGPNH